MHRLFCAMERVGGDAVVMEVPTEGDSDPVVFVHGAQVLMVWVQSDGDWSVQTFDFSRRGRNSLSLWGGGGGKTEGSVPLEGDWDVRVEPRGDMYGVGTESLSDGSLFYLVSCFSRPVGSEERC